MSTFAEVLAQHRAHIGREVLRLAYRHYLSPEELGDFATLVERQFERNDYELLRAFEGRSTWETYLSTVTTRLFFNFQMELWGQWRPSSRAMRLGPAAVLLEELVARDGLAFEAAIEIMRRTHRVDESEYRLKEYYRQLGLDAPAPPDSIAEDTEGDGRKRAIELALRDALAILSAEDRLLLTLRYRDCEPVTRIAKLLKDDPRPLQRRIETAKDVLRTSLTTQGISPHDADAILRNADADATLRSRRKRWWHAVIAWAGQT